MIKLSFSLLGMLVTTVLLAASVFMNWSYGVSLGRTPTDGLIYGAASASADGLMALAPFFGLWAMRHHSWLAVIICVLIWGICTAFSFTSTLGFAALNRSEVVALRLGQAEKQQELQDQISALSKNLIALPIHRPQATLLPVIAAHKQHVRWQSTDKCTNTTVRPSRTYCQKYFSLLAELATSKSARQFQDELAKLKIQREKLPRSGVPVTKTSDPQADILARLTGFDIVHIQTALVLLMALLTELGSGLGFFISLAHFGPKPPSGELTEKDVLQSGNQPLLPLEVTDPREQFFHDAIAYNPHAMTQGIHLYRHFLYYCQTRNLEPDMTLTAFGRWAISFGGLKKQKIGGKIQYLGIKIIR